VPERRCYWGDVIERALKAGEFKQLAGLQMPKDPTLVHSSSWRNELLGMCPKPLRIEDVDCAVPE